MIAKYLSVFIVAILGGVTLISGASASKDSTSDKSALAFEEFCRFKYGPALVGGIGLSRCPTGITIVSLDSKPDTTRFALSAAFQAIGTDSMDLRVRAIDDNGRTIEPTDVSQASGSGTEFTVTTLVCEFATDQDSIDTLFIERRRDR